MSTPSTWPAGLAAPPRDHVPGAALTSVAPQGTFVTAVAPAAVGAPMACPRAPRREWHSFRILGRLVTNPPGGWQKSPHHSGAPPIHRLGRNDPFTAAKGN